MSLTRIPSAAGTEQKVFHLFWGQLQYWEDAASAGHSLSREKALENLIGGGGIAHKAGTEKKEMGQWRRKRSLGELLRERTETKNEWLVQKYGGNSALGPNTSNSFPQFCSN